MKKLYVDMDGTLSRFYDDENCLERMYEDGFFLRLAPFISVVQAVKKLIYENCCEVYVLSCCPTEKSKKEKEDWLKKYLPEIPANHQLFLNVGEDKAKAIGHLITKDDVLLDDYNVNLRSWKNAGGTSVKLVNNINHKGLNGPLWDGFLCYGEASVNEVVEEIMAAFTSAEDAIKEIYYIENTVDERNSRINGYFSTFNAAKNALAGCSDWYRGKGTGKIYKVKLDCLNPHPVLVYNY